MSEPTSDPRPTPDQVRDPESGKVNQKELWYKIRSGLAVTLSLVVLLGGGFFIFSKAQAAWMDFRTAEDYVGEGGEAVVVVIPKGATVSKIGEILVEADVVKSTKAFTKAAQASTASIQAGQYNLRKQLPAETALSMLLDKANLVRNWLTLKEGRTIDQQISVMAKASGVPAADFKKAYKDWKSLELPTWAKNGLEGFLFPETYQLPDKPTATSVINLATEHFSAVAESTSLLQSADQLGLSPYELVVLASIVEKEAGPNEGDRAKIARVFLNRLDKGMKLQSDATVAYANGITGRVFTTEAERQLDSKWNTYLYKGLPKGPITSPSKKSLEAAGNPAAGDWLFFTVVNLDTGETLFANTASEHQANTQKLQQWCMASQANRDKCNGK